MPDPTAAAQPTLPGHGWTNLNDEMLLSDDEESALDAIWEQLIAEQEKKVDPVAEPFVRDPHTGDAKLPDDQPV